MFQDVFHARRNVLVDVRIFDANVRGTAAFLLPGCRSSGFRDLSCGRMCSGCARFRFDQRRQRLMKRLASLRQNHAVLRALRPGKTRFNRSEIEREQFRIFRFRRFLVVEKSLLAAIRFNQSNLLGAASAEFQILQTFFIDRENSAGSPILGRHVSNGGAIRQRKIAQPRPKVLDKFSDNSMLAQHLSNSKDKIGSSSAFSQAPSKLHAHHQRNQHRNRLPQHRSFRFNPAHTPTKHPQPIDHCCVTVCAYYGVGVGCAFSIGVLDEDYSGQVFEIYLVDYASVGGDYG